LIWAKTLIFDETYHPSHISHQKINESPTALSLVEQGDGCGRNTTWKPSTADWVIIDLGPDGGDGGGYVCFEGTPEMKIEGNYTADFEGEGRRR
jgi:excinuclease ABC subunit A